MVICPPGGQIRKFYFYSFMCVLVEKMDSKKGAYSRPGFNSTSTRAHKPGDILVEEPYSGNPGTYTHILVHVHTLTLMHFFGSLSTVMYIGLVPGLGYTVSS